MVPWPSGKAKVCKTFIPQFESGWHLSDDQLWLVVFLFSSLLPFESSGCRCRQCGLCAGLRLIIGRRLAHSTVPSADRKSKSASPCGANQVHAAPFVERQVGIGRTKRRSLRESCQRKLTERAFFCRLITQLLFLQQQDCSATREPLSRVEGSSTRAHKAAGEKLQIASPRSPSVLLSGRSGGCIRGGLYIWVPGVNGNREGCGTSKPSPRGKVARRKP